MSQSLSGPFSHIREDHRKLGTILLELEKCQHASEICRQAEALQPWLQRHFAEEEEPSGVFESIELQDPRHSHQIVALVNEHQIMLDQVVALAEQARSAPSGEQLDSGLAGSVHAFILTIRQHERVESRLLTDAIYHEEGGGD